MKDSFIWRKIHVSQSFHNPRLTLGEISPDMASSGTTSQIAHGGDETGPLRTALAQRRAEYCREQAEFVAVEQEMEEFMEQEAEVASELATLKNQIATLKRRLREKEDLLVRKERGAKVLREHAGVLPKIHKQRRRRVIQAWRRMVAADSSLEQKLRERMEAAQAAASEASLAYEEFRRSGGQLTSE